MIEDKKQIFGWVMYDWANSAYITTVTTAVLPLYFASVVVPREGVAIAGTSYTASSLWAFINSLTGFIVLIFAPILGAISDFSASKKKFLMTFAYTGSLATTLLFFCGSGDVGKTLLLFAIAQICFVAANIFYDAFLPQIASEDKMDWLSGKGFVFGYVGGGLQFALSLGLIAAHKAIGISGEMAARLAITLAGLWWAGFSIITLINLKEPKATEELPAEYRHLPQWWAYTQSGIVRTAVTLRKARKFKQLLLFLVAYMIYTNGIQAVNKMAIIYGTEELKLPTNVLMITLLAIQFISIGGALAFSKLAEKISAKKALTISLVGWSVVVIYAYFLHTATEYFIMGIIVGLVQGGSQSLSRSFYGSIIPKHASAEFYGFYSVFNKGSDIFGSLTFGVISLVTGSPRTAIVSLIVFFIGGLILLGFVDVEKAKAAKL